MARHACVIEDRPLPDPDDGEVLEMLPPAGVTPIIAEETAVHVLVRCGPITEACHCVATRRVCRYPSYASPLHKDTAVSVSAACCLDALFADLAKDHDAMCTNVHVRNPAKRLYERKSFRPDGQGNGPLGLALIKRFR